MKVLDIVKRKAVPEPWAEGEKIPWNEPAFSPRMLKEHLSQTHDAASRRFTKIDQHVQWIHTHVLNEQPTKILDLGCGPGLYAQRLAQLGHTCVGIDFSPASIAYATSQAEAAHLPITYKLQDIRKADYGTGYGLVMLIFGEFNVFRPSDAEHILRKAYQALEDQGTLVLEPHTFAAVQHIGTQGPSWYTSSGGLFSEEPHLCLMENFWNAEHKVTTERYMIVDATTYEVTRYASSMQAYHKADYETMLAQCGFGDVKFFPSLQGSVDAEQSSLLAIVAKKQSHS